MSVRRFRRRLSWALVACLAVVLSLGAANAAAATGFDRDRARTVEARHDPAVDGVLELVRYRGYDRYHRRGHRYHRTNRYDLDRDGRLERWELDRYRYNRARPYYDRHRSYAPRYYNPYRYRHAPRYYNPYRYRHAPRYYNPYRYRYAPRYYSPYRYRHAPRYYSPYRHGYAYPGFRAGIGLHFRF